MNQSKTFVKNKLSHKNSIKFIDFDILSSSFISSDKTTHPCFVYMNRKSVSEMTHFIWRSPSLSELTPMILNMGLTHLGLEGSNCQLPINNYPR